MTSPPDTANNQLLGPEHDRALAHRGSTYVPASLANAAFSSVETVAHT